MGYSHQSSDLVTMTTGGVTTSAEYRLSTFYQGKFSWTNTSVARFEEMQVESDPTHSGFEKELWVFLPKDPELLTYEADGNVLQDGRWNYSWDGENRLMAKQTVRMALMKRMGRIGGSGHMTQL